MPSFAPPFPLVKVEEGKWAFDTYAGLEETVIAASVKTNFRPSRRCAPVDAQDDFASEDRDDDGVEEFAQKLISGEGSTDGLYWSAHEINGESPAGAFVNQAELSDAGKGEGCFGYNYRILTGQGDHISTGSSTRPISGLQRMAGTLVKHHST